MQLFVTITHIVLAFTMILIILLQPGKEGGAALAGGSSGNQMYGPRGAGNFLGKATTFVASGFMMTSIALALYSSEKVQSGSNIQDAIERLEGADDEEGFGIPMPVRSEEPTATEPAENVEPGQDALEAQDAGEEPVGVPASEAPGAEAPTTNNEGGSND
jgi:protein translocase SecG subunit